MKKVSFFFIIVLSILITFSILDEFNQGYYLKIRNFSILVAEQLHKQQVSTFISATEENITRNELVDKLMKFSDDNNIDIISQKTEITATNQNTSSFFIYTNDFIINKDLFVKGSTEIDFKDLNEDGYYSTDIHDCDRTSTLSLLSEKYINGDDNYIIEVKPFHQYKDEIDIGNDAIYVTFYTSDFTELKSKVTSSFSSINPNFLIPSDFHSDLPEANSISLSLKFIAITIGIILLLLTCTINKNMKNISIRKLHGNSIVQIISKLFGAFFIESIVVFIVGVAISYALMVKEVSPMTYTIMKNLSFVIAVFILTYIMLTLLIYIYIKILSTALALKKRQINYTLININLVIKLMLMILIISPFLNIITSGYNSTKSLYDINKYHDRNKFMYSINNIIFNNDIEYYNDASKKIFEVANENDAIYIDTQGILSDYFSGVDVNSIAYTPILIANKQYLKDCVIDKEKLKALNIDSIDGNVILMPENRKSSNSVKVSQMSNVYNAKIIDVSSGVEYYKPNLYCNYVGSIFKDPIILLINESIENVNVTFPYIYFSDKDKMKSALDGAGLKDRYEFCNADSSVQSFIEGHSKNIGKAIVTIVFYTFILLVFLYQSVYLYMEETKRLISLQYVLGHGKISRYSEIIVMNLAPHVFLFMISVLFLSIPIKLILTFCAAFMLIEFLYMVYMIKKFERNTVVVVLKGE